MCVATTIVSSILHFVPPLASIHRGHPHIIVSHRLKIQRLRSYTGGIFIVHLNMPPDLPSSLDSILIFHWGLTIPPDPCTQSHVPPLGLFFTLHPPHLHPSESSSMCSPLLLPPSISRCFSQVGYESGSTLPKILWVILPPPCDEMKPVVGEYSPGGFVIWM